MLIVNQIFWFFGLCLVRVCVGVVVAIAIVIVFVICLGSVIGLFPIKVRSSSKSRRGSMSSTHIMSIMMNVGVHVGIDVIVVEE